MEYLTQLEKMLDTGHRIILMETLEVDRVCDLFLELSRFSNKPYYLGTPEQALVRMDASHIAIPKTSTAEELMEHIEAAQHFGIYVLRNYTELLDDSDLVEDFINIATGENHKVIIMVAEFIKVPEPLKPYAVRSKHQMKDSAKI